jgi:hypothetical protein
MCGVDFGFLDCNQLRQKLIETFGFHKILMLELLLFQERQDELWRSSIFFTHEHKGDDECVKDFKSGCCGSTIFDSLGS